LAQNIGQKSPWTGWNWLHQLRQRRNRSSAQPVDTPRRERRGRVICVASGKGGTGKTVVSTNLAVYLARKGYRVVLFDADLGLANAHLVLGIHPRKNLSHVLHGITSIERVLESGPYGLKVLSGGSGIAELASLSDTQIHQIASQIEILEESYDYTVIDSAAGISPATMAFLYSASEVVVVTTPEITAMTDAYALLKTLCRHHPDSRTWVMANRTRRIDEGREVYDRIRSVCEKYLGHRPRYLGAVPDDLLVTTSIARRRPFLMMHPRTPTSRAFLEAARTLHTAATRAAGGLPTERILPLYRSE
jgi:flagellar biosynthesis protein FlhG